MKGIKIFNLCAAVIMLLSVMACHKEEPVKQETIITCTFAAYEVGTKTATTDGLAPLWTVGDVIKIFDPAAPKSRNKEVTLAASGAAASDTQGVISADGKSFTFKKPADWGNEICAIYPASAVQECTDTHVKINFAGQDGSFAKANICAAKTSADAMTFNNVGAIIKYTSKPANVTKVQVPGDALTKNYLIDFSGSVPSLSAFTWTHPQAVEIGTGTGEVYICVPSESIPAGSIFTHKDANGKVIGTFTTPAETIFQANKVYDLGAMLGALPGKFSVSASKQVQFSRGNLWSNPTVTPQTWSFENDQFSCAPSASGYYVNNHISHFYWEATGNYGTGEKCVTSTGSKSDVLDWGVPFCSANNFATGTWYTLSLEEWKYILNSRSGNRFAKAVVKDLKGLILFPDSYTGTATGAGLAAVNNDEAEFPQTSMSAATWSAMEAAGCVFLPATGFRVYHIFASACVVADVNVGCRYWSATASDSSEGWAYDIAVNDISIAYFGNGSREEGMAVRLVCPIQ